MKKFGNIRIAVTSDKYQVQFKYATPQKIDFFALTLMEIIKHKRQFADFFFPDVLLMLEIPEDLHNIFEDRLKSLIYEYPEMVSVDDDQYYFLDYEVSCFDLTQLGEETYISKEIIEEPKSFSEEFVYEHSLHQLLNVSNATIQLEKEAMVIDTRKDEIDEILIERFTKIIGNQITKFIPTANKKTKIFDMQIAPTNTVHLRDNIEVNLENDKVFFYHKAKTVLDTFLKLPKQEKDSLHSKMFLYLNVPHNILNLGMASISSKRNQPLKMKVIFGNEKLLKSEIHKKGIFECNDETSVYNIPNEEMYVFAGITEKDKTLVFKYSEINEEGYTIPLLEEDSSYQNYLKIFNDIFEQHKELLSDNDTIQFILTITPRDKLKEIIKIIADKNNNSNDIVNTLLSINETATIEVLELIKLYNQLLEHDKINDISHKSNLYALYSDYSKKLGKLKSIGFEHYYSYSPIDWDSFIKEIRLLKPLFDKLSDKLTQQYKKSAIDFFSRVEDDYYDLAPINEKAAKELAIGENWQSDITKALKISKPNFLAIAALIRSKYAEQLRKLEKQKDVTSDNSRQGKKLIEFVIMDNDKINRVYSVWRNLCVLVHPETSLEHKLIKGTDSDRKVALSNAISIYDQILSEKKENPKKDNSKTNNKKK